MIASTLSYFFADLEVAKYFHTLHDASIDSFFRNLTVLGQAEYSLIPALLLYLYYKKRDLKRALKAWFIFVSVAMSGIAVLLIKMFFGRFRPELYFEKNLFGFDFFHIRNSMTSFPSGHSTTAMGVMVGLGILFPKFRIPLFLLGVSIMISRLVIVRHYPSDIMIGGLLGALTSLFLYEYYFKERIENA
jgi:membrane-associated phospholipid phosphatase